MQRNVPDVVGGVLLLALGVGVSIAATSYGLGTGAQIGPGLFPLLLGLVLSGLALVMIVAGMRTAGNHTEPFAWRPLVAISASIATFVGGLSTLGLLPAILLTTVMASLAEKRRSWTAVLLLALVLCVGAWLIFIRGLGLLIPTFRMPF